MARPSPVPSERPGAPAAKGPTIAFITICKGRLHHLKQTLPTMAAQQPDELIVVDYSCPDSTGDWVEDAFPQARVVRVPGQAGFNASRARNAGAAAATSEWLFFVDADILMATGLGDALRAGLRPGNFYRPQFRRDKGEFGSFACRAADFAAIEGYDEVFEGWGYEDTDLYERLALLGVRQQRYSADLTTAIPHDDGERHLLAGMRDRSENELVNTCYGHAKRAISLQRGGTGNLPLAERCKLMAGVRQVVGRWYAAGAAKPLPLRFVVAQNPGHKLATSMWVRTETAITVVLEPVAPSPRKPAPPAGQTPR